MAKMLYTLLLSTHKKGFGKPVVPAVLATGLIFDLGPDGTPMMPDRDAIGDCLPAYYRKAWARCHSISQTSGERGVYYTLRDSRGRWLNTVYALPYTL